MDSVLNRKSSRNINLLAIDYTRSFALSPDSPPAEEPSEGTLWFSGHWILTDVFATQAGILASTLSICTFVKNFTLT